VGCDPVDTPIREFLGPIDVVDGPGDDQEPVTVETLDKLAGDKLLATGEKSPKGKGLLAQRDQGRSWYRIDAAATRLAALGKAHGGNLSPGGDLAAWAPVLAAFSQNPDDESRFASREEMVQEILSVYDPPQFAPS